VLVGSVEKLVEELEKSGVVGEVGDFEKLEENFGE
jgi:hypothetical protein